MTTRREFLRTSAGALAGIEEISDPKFGPLRAKAAPLGVQVFIHPQGAGGTADTPGVSDADKVAMPGGTAMKRPGIKA